MGKRIPTMQKLFFILTFIVFSKVSFSQYTYSGRVFSEVRQRPMTWGNVRLATAPNTRRRNPTIAKVDSLGYFSVTLKDSANVRIVVDCVLDGMAVKTVNYADTLIIFSIQTDCKDYNVERARKDIESNQPKLLCHLGYATYHFSKKDSAFQRNYSILYHTFADEPIQTDCMYLYNKTIAEYLDKKYGDAWRKELRWDVPLD